MTIERTRELLKDDVAGLADSEVLTIIKQRSEFCDVLLNLIETELLTPNKKRENNE